MEARARFLLFLVAAHACLALGTFALLLAYTSGDPSGMQYIALGIGAIPIIASLLIYVGGIPSGLPRIGILLPVLALALAYLPEVTGSFGARIDKPGSYAAIVLLILQGILIFRASSSPVDSGRVPVDAPRPSATTQMEQAVIVRLDPSSAPSGGSSPNSLAELEDLLAAAIDKEALGEFDGHELGLNDSTAILYMYGPDAERLFAGVEGILRSSPLSRGSRVEIRRGQPGSALREIRL